MKHSLKKAYQADQARVMFQWVETENLKISFDLRLRSLTEQQALQLQPERKRFAETPHLKFQLAWKTGKTTEATALYQNGAINQWNSAAYMYFVKMIRAPYHNESSAWINTTKEP